MTKEKLPTKEQIINNLAKNRTIETLINNISKGTFADVDELAQDIYLDLLTKEETKIQYLYESGSLLFFCVRMVQNNLFSTSSRYYKQYCKWNQNKTDLKDEFIGEDFS